jgi:hypothetical protein
MGGALGLSMTEQELNSWETSCDILGGEEKKYNFKN